MTWIVTPRQLSARAELYYQLHQLQSAGIGLIEALQVQHRSPPHPSHKRPIAQIIAALQNGDTLSQASLQTGPWLPTFDHALLQAGENSGRLPESFRLLADNYQNRAQMLREMNSALAYPIFLIHFAVLILPFPALFASGDLPAYLRSTLSVLLPLYAIAGLIHYASQSRRSETWRSNLERVTRHIPIFGQAQRNLALARLCATLEALVSAGVPIIQGWELAADASGSPALKRTVASFRPQLEAGQSPAEAVTDSQAFPDVFSNLYSTGEISGQLDDTLHRLQRLHQEEGSRQFQALARWIPKIAYLIIALVIAYKIISFYTDYFDIDKTLQGF